MPSSQLRTIQGQAWDQAALDRYGSEKRMAVVMEANVEDLDTLLFGGDVELELPDVTPPAIKSLPPWERM